MLIVRHVSFNHGLPTSTSVTWLFEDTKFAVHYLLLHIRPAPRFTGLDSSSSNPSLPADKACGTWTAQAVPTCAAFNGTACDPDFPYYTEYTGLSEPLGPPSAHPDVAPLQDIMGIMWTTGSVSLLCLRPQTTPLHSVRSNLDHLLPQSAPRSHQVRGTAVVFPCHPCRPKGATTVQLTCVLCPQPMALAQAWDDRVAPCSAPECTACGLTTNPPCGMVAGANATCNYPYVSCSGNRVVGLHFGEFDGRFLIARRHSRVKNHAEGKGLYHRTGA